MKYISLLLLFSSICFAQGVKITAYSLINDSDDGPCSVKSYVKNYNNEYFFSHISAESTDEVLMNKLLAVKKQAKQWKSIDFWCEERTIGGDMIYNMITIENSKFKDTIFLTWKNEHIVFPDEGKAYIDEYNVLNKSLTGIIKEFFEYDFQKDLTGMFMGKRDSLSSKALLYKSENIKNYSREKFEDEFGKLTFIKAEEAYGKNISVYTFEGNIYSFENNEKLCEIEINNPDSGWEFDGLSIGDKQEVFNLRYPSSMSFNVITTAKFEEFKKEKLHLLTLNKNEGGISFWIKDGAMSRFIIYYNLKP